MEDPVELIIHVEAHVRVTAPAAVKAAALQLILDADYGLTSSALAERQADLERVRTDIADAVLALAAPDGILSDVDGLEVLGGVLYRGDGDRHAQVGSTPDFARLFVVCHCGDEDCEQCGGYQLTPRAAAVLHHAAAYLADLAYEDVLDHGDDAVTDEPVWRVFDRYPIITYRQNAVWRRQSARAYDDLAVDLAAGVWPEPRCHAEAMALRLIVQDVVELSADLPEPVSEIVMRLPRHPNDDDWEGIYEGLVQDTDISMLFDPTLDGIDHPDDVVNQDMRMGDYRPPAWFDWYNNAEPRDGRRPFRR
jgi:hypothetical protein